MPTNIDGGRKRFRRRLQTRRAWSAIGWGVGLIVALNLAANRWLPEKLAPWRDPFYHVRHELLVRRINQHVCSAPGESETSAWKAPPQMQIAAAFGSSRFMGGLDGKSLESELNKQLDQPWFVINFGSAGGGPMDSLVRLHRLLRQGPRPSLVLLEVLPNQLNSAPGASPPVNLESVFDHDDQECLRKAGISVAADQERRPVKTSCVLWDHRVEFVRMAFPRLLHGGDAAIMMRTCDPYGTVQVQLEPTPPQRQAALESARDTFQTGASQFQFGGDGPRALEAAARLCQEQGLPLVLVIMPEGPTFRSWYRDGAESELRFGIQALATRWNAHVIDCWDSLPEEAFIDSYHLLARAARGFTTDLARKSLAPLEQPEMTPRISTRNVRTESR